MSKLKVSVAMVDSSSSNFKRPLANFHSTVWGNYFLSYTPQLTEISVDEKIELEELKEKVKKMLIEIPNNCTQKLVLIDTIQRLGVAYHFKNEIKTSLQNIFDESEQSKNEDDDDLYIVALRFRLVRQQRHYMSADVFKKFTDHDGKFKKNLTKDVQGLVSLYEATHLRVHDEEILEEALTFTITHLESMVPKLSNSLKAHVREALSQPIYTNLPRLLARKYIGMYEKIELCNDLLLKFAKLDFNNLQKLYQGELGELTRWWKNLDFAKKFPYARDRMVECYFWVAGVYIEPQHGRARKMMTKLLTTYVIIDDTYDAYATYDELVAFTNAIVRCDDISAINSVSPNLRPVYRALLDRYDEIEEELTKEDKLECIYYAKQEMKKVARAYLKEALWLNDVYIPKCEEYMKVAIVSTTVMMAATTFLCVMEENITKETFEWVINEPLILRASLVIGRLKDDINTNNFEQQRSHVASFIECYMKEYGVSKQEARVEARKELTNAWKDMNEEFLRSSEVPTFVLEQVINFARLAYIFKEGDFINTRSEFKNMITLLFVEPVNIMFEDKC
ncbi:germacrene C synthase-like [Solanum tuberosum]|nr:PREDICTED: germacrene C synthase-like [Solanum tuberosum]